ncbi:putative Glycosyl transferase family 8 protein [Paratrimastix pyriformis]|uniref:Glycosyl transferase family 8 protein n=1 Tax=Paratrimastix pyriformis TaxID=342808 RepID=A0ABQ8UEV5_9EUKA|nr:putative Glycosyl transferase family 8 protein [Paratrimastix pyriformis]
MKPFAILTVVFGSDIYVSGALVLAKSIRDHNPLAQIDLVALVTPEITQSARTDLALAFDHVQEVEPISYPVTRRKWKRFEHMYGWIESCFTKMRMLELPYERVLFLDSDMLCRGCIEEIFQMRAPAGILTGDKPVPLAQGAEIPDSMMEESLTRCYGIGGSFIYVEPNKDDFKTMMEELHAKPSYGSDRYNAGPDEQLFSLHYQGRWSHVSPRFSPAPSPPACHPATRTPIPPPLHRLTGASTGISLPQLRPVEITELPSRLPRRAVALLH